MSCAEIRELFSDRLDGGLSLEADDRFGRHLATCKSCREELLRYEAAVGSLAGLQPEPPGELGGRVARRLAAAGLVERTPRPGPGRWGSLAAAAALLAVGVVGGRLTAPPGPAGPRPEAGLATPAWTDVCTGVPVAAPTLDPHAWRATAGDGGPDLALSAGPHIVRLPRRLTSHGPYDPGSPAPTEPEGATCLPLRAPLGGRLTLSLRPGSGGDGNGTDAFVVQLDPRRVLYGRVLWQQQGLAWSLEGRADAAELLDVAREIAARARVERAGHRM